MRQRTFWRPSKRKIQAVLYVVAALVGFHGGLLFSSLSCLSRETSPAFFFRTDALADQQPSGPMAANRKIEQGKATQKKPVVYQQRFRGPRDAMLRQEANVRHSSRKRDNDTRHIFQVVSSTVFAPAKESNASTHETPTGKTFPKIVFGGIMRNMNRDDGYLHYFIPKFLKLCQQIASDFHIVIYENDSDDGTRQVLIDYLGGKPYATLLLEDNAPHAYDDKRYEPVGKTRTTLIANARNNVLEHVRNNFHHYDYFAMLDMDGVCGGPNATVSFDPNIFRYALMELGDHWDVLTFRFDPYFDLWALRHKDFAPYNHWYGGLGRNTIKNPQDVNRWLFANATWPSGLIQVESSFQMFALYRMALLQTAAVASYKGEDENGNPDCEHVYLNKSLQRNLGARVRLSPMVYCQNDRGYKPLSEGILSRLRLSNAL